MINILHTQFYLKSKGIDYMMCNTMNVLPNADGSMNFEMYRSFADEELDMTLYRCDDNNGVMFYLDLIDKDKYKDPFDKEKSFYPYYKNLGYTNEKAKYWHHGEEPHMLYAEELLLFNEENKCLKNY